MQRLGLVTGFVVGVSIGWVARRIDERARKMEAEMRTSNSGGSATLNLAGMEEIIEILRQGLLSQHPDYIYKGNTKIGMKPGICPSCLEKRPEDTGYIKDNGRCFRCDELAAEVNA